MESSQAKHTVSTIQILINAWIELATNTVKTMFFYKYNKSTQRALNPFQTCLQKQMCNFLLETHKTKMNKTIRLI